MAFSKAVIDKADKLLEEHQEKGGLIEQDSQFPTIWWVHSTRDTSKRYRVEIKEIEDLGPFASCTCVHGLNRFGQAECYHVSAVTRMMIREGRELDA